MQATTKENKIKTDLEKSLLTWLYRTEMALAKRNFKIRHPDLGNKYWDDLTDDKKELFFIMAREESGVEVYNEYLDLLKNDEEALNIVKIVNWVENGRLD